MSESAQWDSLRPVLKGLGLDPVRVENPAGPGTPDVNITLGWIELKQVDDWPVKGGALRVPHFTKQQRAWLRRRYAADRRAWMMLKVADDWLLIDGDIAAALVGITPRDVLIANARGHWEGIPNARELHQCLRTISR